MPPTWSTSHSITVKQGLDYSKTRLSSEGSEQVVGSTLLVETSFLQLLRMSWIYFLPCQTLCAFCYYGDFSKEANGAALPATSIPCSPGRNTPAAGHRHRNWLEQVKSTAVTARLWPKQTQRRRCHIVVFHPCQTSQQCYDPCTFPHLPLSIPPPRVSSRVMLP